MFPHRIGRYEIKSELGRGGMATVYRGYDPRFKREVAVKVLPPEFLHDASFRGRFEREAEVIAALEHPAIVPVYDYGEDSETRQPYLVMRLMTGGTLADRLMKGPISLAETARIFGRLAPALDRAHSRGIVHRDLKPGNILFDDENNPYISDFGIAKLTASASTFTGTGMVGTPAYMSPEQARGEKNIDGRSDIYALGAIVFQMLTGKFPYDADTPMGIVVKHITDPVPSILEAKSDLPPSCEDLIHKAMAKQPVDRFSKAAEMARNLESVAFAGDQASTATVAPSATDRREPPIEEVRRDQEPAGAEMLPTLLGEPEATEEAGMAPTLLGEPEAMDEVEMTRVAQRKAAPEAADEPEMTRVAQRKAAPAPTVLAAQPETAAKMTPPRLTRGRVIAGLVGLVGVAAVAGGLVFGFSLRPQATPTLRPTTPAPPPTPRPTLAPVIQPTAAGPGQKDPFIGNWAAVDNGDGSNMRLTITGSAGGYGVVLVDDKASMCGKDDSGKPLYAAEVKFTGTARGEALHTDSTSAICRSDPPSPLEQAIAIDYTFQGADDTLTDSLANVWRRASAGRRLTLWYVYGPGAAEERALNKVLDQARARYPDLQIEAVQSPLDQLIKRYRSEVAEGGGPDLFLAPNDDLAVLAREKLVLPLGADVSRKLVGVTKLAVDGMTVDGQLYGIPESSKVVALYYNRSLLPEPPGSTGALLSAVQDGRPVVVPLNSYHPFGFLSTFGGQLLDEKGRCVLDKTGGVEAMNYLVDLQQAGAVFEPDYGKAQSLFIKGQAAMFTDGPWAMKYNLDQLGDKLGVAPLPGGPGGPARPLVTLDSFSINPNSKNIDLAIELALFMASPEAARVFMEEAGHIPIREDVRVNDPLVRAFGEASLLGLPRPQNPEFPVYFGPFTDMFNRVLKDNVSPAQAVAEACAAMNRENRR